MNKKIFPSSLLILGLLALSYDFFGRVSDFFGHPLLIVGISLIFVSLPLFLVSEQVVVFWSKFAYIWIPATFVLVAIIPLSNHGFMPPQVDKGIYAFLMWTSFVVISFVLISYKYLATRKK